MQPWHGSATAVRVVIAARRPMRKQKKNDIHTWIMLFSGPCFIDKPHKHWRVARTVILQLDAGRPTFGRLRHPNRGVRLSAAPCSEQ